jgi:hypothetical protein
LVGGFRRDDDIDLLLRIIHRGEIVQLLSDNPVFIVGGDEQAASGVIGARAGVLPAGFARTQRSSG